MTKNVVNQMWLFAYDWSPEKTPRKLNVKDSLRS